VVEADERGARIGEQESEGEPHVVAKGSAWFGKFLRTIAVSSSRGLDLQHRCNRIEVALPASNVPLQPVVPRAYDRVGRPAGTQIEVGEQPDTVGIHGG
jgi:hypothetical protein